MQTQILSYFCMEVTADEFLLPFFKLMLHLTLSMHFKLIENCYFVNCLGIWNETKPKDYRFH